MKNGWIVRMGIGLAFLGTLISCSSANKVSRVFNSSPRFDLRDYEVKTLKNGLEVIMIKDESLPSFSLSLMLKSGSASDPNGKSGLTAMVANLLEKGSAKRDATQIADAFGQIGSDFSASVAQDYIVFSAQSLSFQLDTLLNDFAEVLLRPAFSVQEMERLRALTLSKVKNIYDQPDDLADVAFNQFLYQSHPYAKMQLGTVKDLQGLKRRDVIKHYFQQYRPNNAILAVVGRFDDSIFGKIEAKFGQWQSRPFEPRPETPFPEVKGLNLQIVDKSDLKQSQIIVGHKGIQRKDTNFLVLRVANLILGGDLSSRLSVEVRVKRGLTYSISSRFEAKKDFGPFLVSTFTRHDKVGETVSEILRTLKVFRDNGVSEDELERVKALLRGQFPRTLETSEALAFNLSVLRLYGIPDSYLENYLDEIAKITKSQVDQAIQNYIRPEDIKVLVLSPKDKSLGQLKPLGNPKVLNFRDVL